MKSRRRKKKTSKDFDDDILFDLDYDSDLKIEDYDFDYDSDFKIEDYDFDLVSFDTELEDLLLDTELDISDPIDAADPDAAAQAAGGAGASGLDESES